MKKFVSRHDVQVISFTDQFVSYLAISDVMITKAGGLTLSEALACEIPLILYESIPGHEEQNAMIAVKWGVAIHAFERNDLSKKVKLILTNQRIKDQMIQAARQHKKPHATEEIVNFIQQRSSTSVSSKMEMTSQPFNWI